MIESPHRQIGTILTPVLVAVVSRMSDSLTHLRNMKHDNHRSTCEGDACNGGMERGRLKKEAQGQECGGLLQYIGLLERRDGDGT